LAIFEPKKRHLREILLYFFNVTKSALESHRLLVETYDEAALNGTMYRDWFRRFKSHDIDVKDKERDGRLKLV